MRDKPLPPAKPIVVSPKPEMPMQDEPVRSKDGDMVAFLPVGWFLLDIEGKASTDVFAIGVNPDYTLSIVFSSLRPSEKADSFAVGDGAMVYARSSFQKRQRKTAGASILKGKIGQINVGSREFGFYHYTTPTATSPVSLFSRDSTPLALVGGVGTASRVGVFKSSLNNLYELAVIPVAVLNRDSPSEEEVERVFRSVLSSVQY